MHLQSVRCKAFFNVYTWMVNSVRLLLGVWQAQPLLVSWTCHSSSYGLLPNSSCVASAAGGTCTGPSLRPQVFAAASLFIVCFCCCGGSIREYRLSCVCFRIGNENFQFHIIDLWLLILQTLIVSISMIWKYDSRFSEVL